MKSFLSILFLFAFFAAPVIANAADASNENAPQTVNSEQIGDAQILDVLVVLNQNEIQLSQEALIRSQTPSVRKYAQQMKKDHSKNLQITLSLSKKIRIAPKLSDISSSLHKKGEASLQHLKEDSNEDFNNDYINMMVKNHKEALDNIKDNLLPNVSNATLRRHLESTKADMTRHLKTAVKIQKLLAQ